jgi:hypothetical protein
MKTEFEIVYDIINAVNGAEHNNDLPVHENLVRSMLRKYRADSIRKAYKDGHVVNDEAFQTKTITTTLFTANPSGYELKGTLPQIIRMNNNYGMYLSYNEVELAIVDSFTYMNSKKNFRSQVYPFAKTDQSELVFYAGIHNSTNLTVGGEVYFVTNLIHDHILAQKIANANNNTTLPVTLNLKLKSILVDPDDGDFYNWETSPYPFPAERVNELESQIMVKEFGIILQTKKDEVQNARADQIRYHDNEQIDQ